RRSFSLSITRPWIVPSGVAPPARTARSRDWGSPSSRSAASGASTTPSSRAPLWLALNSPVSGGPPALDQQATLGTPKERNYLTHTCLTLVGQPRARR